MRSFAWVFLIAIVPVSAQRAPHAPRPNDPILVPQGIESPAPTGKYVSVRRKRFLLAYDKLIASLNEFSEVYYNQRGEVMPLDKVNAVKKAWRDLQKAEPAFK